MSNVQKRHSHLTASAERGVLMARPAYGGRTTCESCTSIDIRRWHHQGRLRPGQHFSWSWTRGGEPAGSITVRTEWDAVILIYRSRGRERVEIDRAAGADRLDGVPPRWPTAVVRLFGLLQWPLLRATRRGALLRRRAVCLPPVLWPCLCKPARDTDASGDRPSAEDQGAARWQSKSHRSISGEAARDALEHLPAVKRASRYC
jgi:hypothetical protein